MTLDLLGRHEKDDLVAFGKGGDRTAENLLGNAAAIAKSLPPATEGSHVLLVFQNDRYAFATALLGTWAAGHAVALPPNTRRDAVLLVLSRPETVAMLHDTDSGKPVRIAPFSSEPSGPPLNGPVIPARDVVATMFTSGSQGEITACDKTYEQLLTEATVLTEKFSFEGGDRVVPTVQPGHIYGLLFSVLTPLVSGAAFLRQTPFHAEAIAEAVRTHQARILVTVPAHLRALCATESGALGSLERDISTTGPLRTATANAFVSAHQKPITEILGSTETGGIAWRDRSAAAWHPLPRVEVSIDAEDRLWVKSPFSTANGSSAVRTADLAQSAPDGTFVHLGRSDGIVKIGGQRVSLPAMEQWLAALRGVHDAAVVAVPARAGRDTELLAAAVAPDWTVKLVQEALAQRFVLSAVPRRIAIVDALPREDNGKLQRSRVLRLFGLTAEGEAIRWSFDWEGQEQQSENGRSIHRYFVHVPKTYGAFEGHFPGYPILPAAFQLGELVLPCVRKARPDVGDVHSVRKLKFLGRILPDDHLEVEIAWADGDNTVDFSLRRGDKVCSGGRILFAKERT